MVPCRHVSEVLRGGAAAARFGRRPAIGVLRRVADEVVPKAVEGDLRGERVWDGDEHDDDDDDDDDDGDDDDDDDDEDGRGGGE